MMTMMMNEAEPLPLENRYAGIPRIEGLNPSLSASTQRGSRAVFW